MVEIIEGPFWTRKKKEEKKKKKEKKRLSIVTFHTEAGAMNFCAHNPTMNLIVVKEVDERFHVYNMEA